MYPNKTALTSLHSAGTASSRTCSPLYASVWLALLQQLRRRQRLRAWLLQHARLPSQRQAN